MNYCILEVRTERLGFLQPSTDPLASHLLDLLLGGLLFSFWTLLAVVAFAGDHAMQRPVAPVDLEAIRAKRTEILTKLDPGSTIFLEADGFHFAPPNGDYDGFWDYQRKVYQLGDRTKFLAMAKRSGGLVSVCQAEKAYTLFDMMLDTATKGDSQATRAIDLVVVIDVSGSMYGTRAQIVDGLTKLSEKARKLQGKGTRFRIALIKHDTSAAIVSDFTYSMDHFIERLKDESSPLPPSKLGEEAVLDGLMLTKNLIWSPGAERRIIVFADEPNEETTSDRKLRVADVMDQIQETGPVKVYPILVNQHWPRTTH